MSNNSPKINMEKLSQYLMEVMSEKLNLNELVHCRRCGWCCRDTTPRLLPGELELMYESLNIDKSKFIEKYINTEWFDKKKEYALKGPCPFLNKDKDNRHKCQIYPFRPFVCRMFPFGGMMIVVEPCQKGKDIYDILWKWYEDHREEKEVINYQEIESMDDSLKNIIKEKHPGRKFIEELDNPNDAKSHSEIVLFTDKNDFKRIRKYLKKRKNVYDV
jgi:Fe-S-cluster containining protein